MIGSEKQIKWAEDIKAKFAAEFDDATKQNADKIESAKWWIDHRNDDVKKVSAIVNAICDMPVFENKKAAEIRQKVIDMTTCVEDFDLIKQIVDENWWIEHEQYARIGGQIMSHVFIYVRKMQKG